MWPNLSAWYKRQFAAPACASNRETLLREKRRRADLAPSEHQPARHDFESAAVGTA
jgi:hypothetical protein